MNRSFIFDAQALEPRRLLSATPTATAPNSTLLADHAAVLSAEHTFHVDVKTGRKTIKSDSQAIVAEIKKLVDQSGEKTVQAAVKPLKTKLRKDTQSSRTEISATEKALGKEKQKDLKLIRADTLALRKATRASDTSAINAAKAKLSADKAAMQTDLQPLRDAVTTARTKWQAILKTDAGAITKALENLDPALTPLFDKLDSDATALESKLSSDATAVADALSKLKSDALALRKPASPNNA
jgi:hypothetical protein